MSLLFPTNNLNNPTGGDIATAVHLGMPHLDQDGLSLNWVLRECCHNHWWSIAESLQKTPSQLTDMTGTRMLPSVVAATLQGRLSQFQEDQHVSISRILAPSRETGWRSVWCVQSADGAAARIELITRFAKRDGVSNTKLTAASLYHELLPYLDGVDAERTLSLEEQGRAQRALAPEAGAPLYSLPVARDAHFNGVGLMYFANFVDPIAQAERRAVPAAFGAFETVSRDLHYFGNIDAGDTLDIDCIPRVSHIGPNAEIVLNSFARRRSDDKIVAVCCSRNRPVTS